MLKLTTNHLTGFQKLIHSSRRIPKDNHLLTQLSSPGETGADYRRERNRRVTENYHALHVASTKQVHEHRITCVTSATEFH